MSEYLEDPSLLTKEKLKNELIANNIVLPSGEQRKEVYVQLYRKHLSSRNRATPEFSSDEEREATPVRSRGRPPGRKATKKTDKPTVEGKNESDITSLSNEALRDELLKYGVKPGPILDNTRKVYEQRLSKLKEQEEVVSVAPPVAELSTADNKQNGNTDSGHYSDNDEARTDLTFEPREPLRSKPKAQVTSRSKRQEQNESMSADAVSELPKTLESEKVGRLLAVSKESTKVTRRTPRKRVVAAEAIDDEHNSEAAPVAETVLASSNQTLANAVYSQFESRQIDYQTVEKSFIEERRDDRDILKEMFPNETSTPTGISASCRRPIKGAAGRPFNIQDYKDYKLEESYSSSKYILKHQPVVEEKTTKGKSGRSIPIWIKLLIFLILAVLAFFVYQAMETNEGNPFAKLLQGNPNISKDEN
ncbi:thymopoietin isoform X5 [Bufo gargarizans]|uniref:thymopoietin isoform X5 n=1 Tax=Bufo gargarizans TaxID=30331 RepID=UPI001CF39CA6|nr:thymopoietin isoform X5 [Bufo gargarizans]